MLAVLACATALAGGSDAPRLSSKRDRVSEARLQALADKWRLTAAQAKAAGKPDGAGK